MNAEAVDLLCWQKSHPGGASDRAREGDGSSDVLVPKGQKMLFSFRICSPKTVEINRVIIYASLKVFCVIRLWFFNFFFCCTQSGFTLSFKNDFGFCNFYFVKSNDCAVKVQADKRIHLPANTFSFFFYFVDTFWNIPYILRLKK